MVLKVLGVSVLQTLPSEKCERAEAARERRVIPWMKRSECSSLEISDLEFCRKTDSAKNENNRTYD